jgi:hypothetical protein
MRFDRHDAATQAFIQQTLQYLSGRIVTTPFGPKRAAALIPLEGDVPEGAQEWGYDRVTHTGIAQWISSTATDIPFANMHSQRVMFPMRKLGVGYHVADDDVAAAMMSGMNVPANKAIAAREAVDRFENNVWISGDATVGMEGFINASNVTAGSVVTGTWASATPAQILADMHTVLQSIKVTTRQVYEADTIVLPIVQRGLIQTTPYSTGSDLTIEEYFLRNHRGVRFEELAELDGAGAGGTDRMIVYKRDPQVLVAKYSVIFHAKPPQEQGYGYNVPCYGKIGGVAWMVPIAAAYGDGI